MAGLIWIPAFAGMTIELDPSFRWEEAHWRVAERG
jgi:hypothetical protein